MNAFFMGVGGVLSADIAVPDHEREVQFYSQALTTGSDPFWREDLMNNLGMPIIGLGHTSPEYSNLPLQWMPHIQVADVAASAHKAVELGGTELMHGKDKEGNSSWAVLTDSNDAAFGIVPVLSPEAMPPIEVELSTVGRIVGLDLTVQDTTATRDFYESVVGWSAREIEMEDGSGSYADFELLGANGNPVAQIHHARGSNSDLPSVWMLCIPVGDLTESISLVDEAGGSVLKTVQRKDGSPSLAYIQDLVGAKLALVAG